MESRKGEAFQLGEAGGLQGWLCLHLSIPSKAQGIASGIPSGPVGGWAVPKLLSRPPGMAVPPAPAACSACARWMSTLPVRPHLVWCWGGAPVSALGVLWPPRSHQLLSVCRQRHGFWGSDLTSPPDAAPCHSGRGGCRALLLCRDGRGPRLRQEVSPCLALSCPPPRCGRHLGAAQRGCAWGSSLRAGPGAQSSCALQRGPPGPGDGAAVLRLPCCSH